MPIVYGIMKGNKNMNIKGIHANHGTSIHEFMNGLCKPKKHVMPM